MNNILCLDDSYMDGVYSIDPQQLNDHCFEFIGIPSIHEHIILNDECAELEFSINDETYVTKEDAICGKLSVAPKIRIKFLDLSKTLIIVRLSSHSLFKLTNKNLDSFINKISSLDQLDILNEFNALSEISTYETLNELLQKDVNDLNYKRTIKIVQYIENYYFGDEQEKISSISEAFAITDRTIRRDLKKYIGMTLSHITLILKRRNIVEGLFYNIYDSLTVQEVGYYDQSHCIKDFKRTFGLPPKQYCKYLKRLKNAEPLFLNFLFKCANNKMQKIS